MRVMGLKKSLEAVAHSLRDQEKPQFNSSRGDQCIAFATVLALLPFGLFAFSSLIFLFGAKLNFLLAWILIVLSAFSALTAARLSGASIRTLLLAAIFVIVAGLLSHFIIDISYDGQQYHYDAIRALAMGWNPVLDAYQPASPMAGLIKYMLWPSHYPQAAWRVSATLLAAGIDAEAASLAALLLAGALSAGAAGLVLRYGFSRTQAAIAAILVAGNPVIVTQLFTRMNDGMLCSCIGLALIFTALSIQSRSACAGIVAIAAIAFAINLKFSAIPLLAMFSLAICAACLISVGWRRGLPVGCLLLTGGVCGVFVFGAHPYLTNMIHNGHPFYPLMGANSVDIMTVNRPPSFQAMHPIERNIAALFSQTAAGLVPADYALKWPLTTSVREVLAIGHPDPRLSGFGPFFSGALLVALWTACAIVLKWKRNRWAVHLLGIALAIGIISWLMPEAWWARYCPQFWWIPILIGLAATTSPHRLTRYSGMAVVFILMANVGLTVLSAARFNIGGSDAIRDQLAQIEVSHAGLAVYLGEAHARLPLLSAASGGRAQVTSSLPSGCSPAPLALTEPEESGYCLIDAQR